jgi:hypothetical protein
MPNFNICKQCGKQLKHYQRKFCCRSCYAQNRIQKRIPKICPTCGKEFFKRNQEFCNIVCSHKNVRRRNPVERFWKKVLKTQTCWIWMGGHNEAGYGTFFRYDKDGNGRFINAHRFSWEICHGTIPFGKQILHKCDNPRCVRPDHLAIGTQSENILDSMAKERFPSCKVKATDIIAIRNDPRSQTKIARDYGTTRSCIQHIKSGRSWRHIK